MDSRKDERHRRCQIRDLAVKRVNGNVTDSLSLSLSLSLSGSVAIFPGGPGLASSRMSPL